MASSPGMLAVRLFLVLVIVAAFVLLSWLLADRCPNCGSRSMGRVMRGRNGRLEGAVCAECGYRWLAEWVKPAALAARPPARATRRPYVSGIEVARLAFLSRREDDYFRVVPASHETPAPERP